MARKPSSSLELDVRRRFRLSFLATMTLLILPLHTFLVFIQYLRIYLSAAAHGFQKSGSTDKLPRTVLITGITSADGLSLARTFWKAGHRVIGVDFVPQAYTSPARLSKALHRFYALNPQEYGAPKVTASVAYADDLEKIIRKERVDVWILCKPASKAISDIEARRFIEKLTTVKIIGPTHEALALLNGDQAYPEPKAYELIRSPEHKRVTSRSEIHRTLHTNRDRQYILESDAHPDMKIRLPLPTVNETYHSVASINISPSQPWILRQDLSGQRYEAYTLVVRGEVKAFSAFSSSYYTVPPPEKSAVARAMLSHTKTLANRLHESNSSASGFTSHLSLNFTLEEHTTEKGIEGELFCTSYSLYPSSILVKAFRGREEELASAYIDVLEGSMSSMPMQSKMVNGVKPPSILLPSTTPIPSSFSSYSPSSSSPPSSGSLSSFRPSLILMQYITLPYLRTLSFLASKVEQGAGTGEWAWHELWEALRTEEEWFDEVDGVPLWWEYQVRMPVAWALGGKLTA